MVENLFWLVVCIYHEAQGEPEEGKIAVGHVILNRVDLYKDSIKKVVLRPSQFSWANGGNRPPIKDYSAFIACTYAAIRCTEQRAAGERFHGCTHYFGDYISRPVWAKYMTDLAHIGKHLFVG